MMYGYRQIGQWCVNCLTWDEAMEIALLYARYGGNRFKVIGELAQHFQGWNIAVSRTYCYNVIPTSEERHSGNQRIKGNSRSNGRTVSTPRGSET